MSIKGTYVSVVVAAAMTAALIGQPTAHAETTITKYLTRFGAAVAGASAQKINECEYADFIVEGIQSTNKEGKWQTKNEAFVLINISDLCTGTSVEGIASFDGAFVPPKPSLQSAATDELIISETCHYVCSPGTCDYVCSPAYISVKATWTGVGNIERGSYLQHNKTGSYNYVSKSSGTFRHAEVAVELNINDMAVPIDPDSVYGDLRYDATGYVEITRN